MLIVLWKLYFSLIPKFYYLAYLQNVTTKAFTNIIYSAFHIQDSSYTYHVSVCSRGWISFTSMYCNLLTLELQRNENISITAALCQCLLYYRQLRTRREKLYLLIAWGIEFIVFIFLRFCAEIYDNSDLCDIPSGSTESSSATFI